MVRSYELGGISGIQGILPQILVGLLCLAVPAAVQLLDLTVKGVQGALNLVRLVLDVGGKLLDGGKRYLDVFAH